jgi:potassium/hydrogen antiporter
MIPRLDTLEGVLGLAALVLLLAVVAVRWGHRLGMPSLLVFLGIGLLLGEGGVGIKFSTPY